MSELTQQTQTEFALFPQSRTSIDALAGRVDVYPVEEHNFAVKTTEYPVESGSVLTDQAVAERATLRLDGHVSDILPAPGNTLSPDRMADTWNAIERLRTQREPVTVVTDLRVYRNMLIVRARARVNASTGRALSFQLDLAEILFTDTELVRIAPEQVDGEGPAADRTSTVDRGDVDSPEVETS